MLAARSKCSRPVLYVNMSLGWPVENAAEHRARVVQERELEACGGREPRITGKRLEVTLHFLQHRIVDYLVDRAAERTVAKLTGIEVEAAGRTVSHPRIAGKR